MNEINLDYTQILKLIPHRLPFLLIDRVENLVPDTSAVGIKSVTVTEPHFAGHFPNYPVMPGVLIIEAMAQTAGIAIHSGKGDAKSSEIVFFAGIDIIGNFLEKSILSQNNLSVPETRISFVNLVRKLYLL